MCRQVSTAIHNMGACPGSHKSEKREIPIEKFYQTASKPESKRKKVLRLKIHQEGEILQLLGKRKLGKGFSSGMIPEGVRLTLASKNHQVQASGMS